MNQSPYYLSTLVPQWGVFIGIGLLVIGYIDKRSLLTRLGWGCFVLTSLYALFALVFGELRQPATPESLDDFLALRSAAWQTVAGGVLALTALLFFHFGRKRYGLLAVLTILYFVLNFFIYKQATDRSSISKPKTEKSQTKALVFKVNRFCDPKLC